MPYGHFTKPIVGYTKTIHSANRSSGSLIYNYPERFDYFNHAATDIVRVGGNSPNFHAPKSIYDIPYYELQSYKKVIGFSNRVKKVYYWEKSENDPSISVRKFKKVSYKKKVFGYGIRWQRKKLAPKQESSFLLAPNPLTYLLQESSCDAQVISLRQVIGDPSLTYYDNQIEFSRFPGESVARDADGFPLYSFNGGWGDDRSLFFPTIGSPSLPAFLADDCLSKLYSKVANEFPDYVTDVIQIKSTWKTITKIAKAAIEVVYAMKKLDLKRLAGTLPGVSPKEISSLWLEFIYGVSPVLQDIDQSIDLYLREARRWRTYSCSKREIVKSTASGSIGSSSRPIYTYEDEITTTYTIRYGVIMAGDQSFVRKVRDDNRMSSAFSTAYEIIPYSFCIDWIYNLGNYLSARDSLDDFLLYNWRTILVETKTIRRIKVNTYPDQFVHNSGNNFTLTFKQLSVVRDPYITMPEMPIPRVKRLTEVFSWKRSVNALALFTQLVTGR